MTAVEIVPHWIDVTAHLASGIRPEFFCRRDAGAFWVAQDAVLDAPAFALVRSGDTLRIPVSAYRTTHRAAAAIFALGLQIALTALTALRDKTSDPVTSAVLVLGHECTDLAPDADGYRCYVGIAFRTN